VIAEFSVPETDFTLGKLFDVRAEITVRLESIVPTGEEIIPYFWVPSDAASAVESALREDDLTEHVEIVDELDEETLFQVDWSSEVNGLLEELLGSQAVVLEAEGRDGIWSLQVRFPDYDALSEFYRRCREKGIELDPGEVHNPIQTDGDDHGLTPEQRETLLTALEGGYYSVPREMTLAELGEELDISDTAASQRLRRGLSSLLTASLRDGEEDAAE